jgi:formylglycine-generating enzyme required for sulfatase activity
LSDRPSHPAEEESVALRAELERVQEAARQALSKLRDEVDYLRETRNPGRDIDFVTAQVALEQELDTLRRALREKERLVEETAAQCRRLEDELEDQHLAYEGLKQDLERKALSLEAAHSQLSHMSQERHEAEERYQELLTSKSPGHAGAGSSGRTPTKRAGGIARLLVGLVAGGLLSLVGLALWLKLDPFSISDAHPSGETKMVSPSVASTKTAPTDPGAVQESASEPAGGQQQPEAVEVRQVKDRFSDGSAGPSMMVVGGGDFTMGRPLALSDEDEGPIHGVRVSDFLISATEVTFEEYDRFARATGRRLPNDFGWGRGKRPVVDVSWEDARAYARWLSRRTGKRYRLPSESEWEYAAAAGKSTFFWWGLEPGQGRAACMNCGTRWDDRSTAPVGSFRANPFGLYDTAGNVMEWVEDCYHPNYVGAPANGKPWGEASCSLRVVRGGAFNKPARSMYSTARQSLTPETRLNDVGFRVARDG